MNDVPSMADAPRSVFITTDGPKATVVIDGTDMSNRLSGYQIDHRAGQHPFVVLFSKPGTETVFDGMAQVAVATETPPGDAIAAFLRAVDPAVLERAAFERDDLDGSSHELTKALLMQLADWAQGKGLG